MGALHEALSSDLAGIKQTALRLSSTGGDSEVYDAFNALSTAALELIPLLGEDLRPTDDTYLKSAKQWGARGVAIVDDLLKT